MHINDQLPSVPEEHFGDQSKISENTGEFENNEFKQEEIQKENDDLISENVQNTEKPVNTEKKDQDDKGDNITDLTQGPQEDDISDSLKEEEDKEDIDDSLREEEEEEITVDPDEAVADEDSINYASLSNTDLLSLLEEIILNKPVTDIRNEVEAIKTAFYKKHRLVIERKRKNL